MIFSHQKDDFLAGVLWKWNVIIHLLLNTSILKYIFNMMHIFFFVFTHVMKNSQFQPFCGKWDRWFQIVLGPVTGISWALLKSSVKSHSHLVTVCHNVYKVFQRFPQQMCASCRDVSHCGFCHGHWKVWMLKICKNSDRTSHVISNGRRHGQACGRAKEFFRGCILTQTV